MAWLLRSSLHRLALVYGFGLLLAFAIVGGVSLWAFDHLLERDIEQAVTMEHQGLMEVFRSDGRTALAETINERSDSPEDRGSVYLLIGANGQVLAGRGVELDAPLPKRDEWIRFPSLESPQGDEVLAYAHALSGGGWLVTGHTTGEQGRMRELFLRLGGISLVLLAALTILLVWLLRRSIDHSLITALDTVDRVAAGHLDERVPELPGDDGFARLGRTLNRMLGRFQDLVGGIQSSTDAIAHDLRTPLMRLRARLELLQSCDTEEEKLRESEAAITEVDQLVATFNSLLRLSRIEATGGPLMETVDLEEVVLDALDLWQALAESQGQSLVARTVPARITGDRDLLFQMISNLLDNAIKYSGTSGEISLDLTASGDQVVLVVGDHGPGIVAEQRERVFDRFVRLEHHRGTSGSGLGLSGVRAIAIRHGADLRLESASPGLRVRLQFPIVGDINNRSSVGKVQETGESAICFHRQETGV